MIRLWTIGHSTRPIEEFLGMLAEAHIEILVDVRRFPASRRHPHFKTDRLKRSLHEASIRYEYLGDELGGFRKTTPASPNVGLTNASFRGYADWTQSDSFREGVRRLLATAGKARVAYMCAERPIENCHRRILSDYLALVHGAEIIHLVDPGRTRVHPLTPTVRKADDGILYDVVPSKPTRLDAYGA